jgi:hypothetical protein
MIKRSSLVLLVRSCMVAPAAGMVSQILDLCERRQVSIEGFGPRQLQPHEAVFTEVAARDAARSLDTDPSSPPAAGIDGSGHAVPGQASHTPMPDGSAAPVSPAAPSHAMATSVSGRPASWPAAPMASVPAEWNKPPG